MKRVAALVFLLAASVALPTLWNGFVYDDVLLIVDNLRVHGLAGVGGIWQGSYWPAGGLYRPLTLQLFALEWSVGGGRAGTFHAVNVVLNAAAAVLTFRLLVRILEPRDPRAPDSRVRLAAGLGAALFAVHPVHVEAVANVVGQSELLVAICALLSVERYLHWRRSGERGLSRSQRLALAGLTLLGILAKETGYVIPVLLGAAELILVRSNTRTRGSVVAPFVWQGSVVVAALLWRLTVLGSLAGEQPSPALQGLGLVERGMAMLAIVPEWARLLLWPIHLQAEYGPPALALIPALGPRHIAGLGLLGLAIVVIWRARRDHPPTAFALLWILIALAPVANLLVPTGVVLAERTLYLASAGVSFGAAALVHSARPLLRRIAWVGGLGLLAGGVLLTLQRQGVWQTQEGFFERLVRDGPTTYRAHLVASRYYYGEQRWPDAEAAARRALDLHGADPQVHEHLGQVLRVRERCDEALPILDAGLRLDSTRTTLRSRLIECALAQGDTGRARSAAEAAVRSGQSEFRGTLDRLTGRPSTR